MERASVNAVVTGLWRGVDLGGEAQLDIARYDLTLVTRRGAVSIPYTSLDGVRVRETYAELYLDTGDVLSLDQVAALTELAAEIERRACALPEVTRSLRALGSPRAAPTPEHDRFFAPLLEARRVAEGTTELDEVLRAFEPKALRAGILQRLSMFAAERYPDDPPERRALEAELHECAETLCARFDALARCAEGVRASGESERFVAWRAWARELMRTFECADECWLALRMVLVESRRTAPKRHRWRRRA
ncbi:MAG TPA: hypothetical protein VF166_11190 [Gemmatimonadaceae bacterium]